MAELRGKKVNLKMVYTLATSMSSQLLPSEGLSIHARDVEDREPSPGERVGPGVFSTRRTNGLLSSITETQRMDGNYLMISFIGNV